MSKALKGLQDRAASFNIAVTDTDTEDTLREKLIPVETALAERDAKLEAQETAHAEEVAKLKGEEAVKDNGGFTLDKKKYEFTVAEFRFQGQKLVSKDLNAKENKELLEKLVEAKSFVIKAL